MESKEKYERERKRELENKITHPKTVEIETLIGEENEKERETEKRERESERSNESLKERDLGIRIESFE